MNGQVREREVGCEGFAWLKSSREIASVIEFISPWTCRTLMSTCERTRVVTAHLMMGLNSGQQRRDEKMSTMFMLSV